MLIISCRIAQSAALVFKLNVSCITTQQIVYWPVNVPLSVSISRSKSVSCWVSSPWLKNSAQRRAVCKYVYPAGKLTIWALWGPEVLPVGAGGMLGWGGVGSGVRCLHWSGGGASVCFGLQPVSGFFAVPFWQGWQPEVWFWLSIARWLSIAAFTILCPGNWTPCYFSSWTSSHGFLMIYFILSIAVHKKPSFVILPIFNASRMLDCSSCTRPPCLAIVAHMLKTYKKLVAASNNEIWLLPLSYMLP